MRTRLTESDLTRIVRRVINENAEDFKTDCETIKKLTGDIWMVSNECIDSENPQKVYETKIMGKAKQLISVLQKLNSIIPTVQQPISDVPTKPESSVT